MTMNSFPLSPSISHPEFFMSLQYCSLSLPMSPLIFILYRFIIPLSLDHSLPSRRLENCSRWSEMTECLRFHIDLAVATATPSEFRLVNGMLHLSWSTLMDK